MTFFYTRKCTLAKDSIDSVQGDPLAFDYAYQDWINQFDVLSTGDKEQITAHIAAIQLNKINIHWRLSNGCDQFQFGFLLKSLQAQLFSDWHVTMLIPCDFPLRVTKIISDATKNEPRLTLCKADSVKARSLQTESSSVLLIEGEGELAPHALYLLALEAKAGFDFVYADEDQINMLGRHSPVFKPKYSPEFAKQTDYLGSLGLISSRHPLVNGAVDDFINQHASLASTFRRLLVLQGKQVAHVPFVLFHAVHKRTRSAESIQYKPFTNNFAANSPKVSIIIPTKNHLDFLQPCLESIFEKTLYPSDAYEIIVIDNGSTDSDALAYMAELAETGKIRLLKDPSKFNFSRLNNNAVQICKGEILVFLNNDTVIDHPNWLDMLVEQAIKPDVGVVGGKLLYPDRTIQHAGLVLGLYGFPAVHVHTNWTEYADTYMNFNNTVHEISTITGACIALKKQTFQEVGGFDEKLAVAFNDVVLCLAILSQGYRNIYIGKTLAIHYEQKTRGKDDTDEKQLQFKQEAAYTRGLFHELIKEDPFYNPNLSWLNLYGLAQPPRVKKPWLQFNAKQSGCLNILFLTAAAPRKQNMMDLVMSQAHYFLSQGHRVYVDGCQLQDATIEIDCNHKLYDVGEAAIFAIKNKINCIIAHGVPYYSCPRWLGKSVATIAIDYGGSDADSFDTEQAKKHHLADRELSMCTADLVCTFSEWVETATHHHNRMILPKNDLHLELLHTQVVNLVKSSTS